MVLPATAAPSAADFEHSRLGWNRAEMSATKLFQTMRVSLEVAERTGADVAADLLAPDTVPGRAPGAEVVDIRNVSDGLGRRSDIHILVKPASGEALQRTRRDSGNRNRYRIKRYDDAGVFQRTWRPDDGEESLSRERWTRVSSEWHPFPADRPDFAVTDPSAIIYLAATSALHQPGEEFEVLAYANDKLTRITVSVLPAGRIDVDYRVVGDGADGKRDESGMDTVRMSIRGRPLDGSDDGNFEFLGLRNVELFLDPETRAPLMLTGKVKVMGRVKLRLRKLEVSSSEAPRDARRSGL